MQKERLHQYLEGPPSAAGFVLCQTETERLSGDEGAPAQASQAAFARVCMAAGTNLPKVRRRLLASTLKSWLEPIVRMWRFSISTEITEGFHTKMEML